MTRLSDRELAVLESTKGSLSHLEAQVLIAEARRLQNEQVAELLRRMGRAFARLSGLAAFGRFLHRRALYRRTLAELSRLDEAQLLDIGLSRAELAAKALATSKAAAPALPGWWSEAFARARRWRVEFQTANELRRLDDRMLRDIGLERGEIDSVAALVAAGRSRTAVERPAATSVFGLKRPAMSDGTATAAPANSERAAAA